MNKCSDCFWWSRNEKYQIDGRRMCMRITETNAGAHAGNQEKSVLLFTHSDFGCTDFEQLDKKEVMRL